jgi:hypothetical protein
VNQKPAASLKIGEQLLKLLPIAYGLPLIVYGYLGTFSRHLADDYCTADLIRGNFFLNLWHNYQTVSDRFSNFLFIAGTEVLWPRSVSILSIVCLTLWAIGLAWLLIELALLAGETWSKPFALTLSASLIFFAILLAANLYQTLYWRASIAAHLVPLVLMPYLFLYLAKEIRKTGNFDTPTYAYPLIFVISFIIGDFSEPTAAVMIMLLVLLLISTWFFHKGKGRGHTLLLLGWALLGGLAALMVMALSPANAFRLGTPPPPFPELVSLTLRYTFEYITGTFRNQPLPALVIFLVSFVLFYNRYLFFPSLSSDRKNILLVLSGSLPVLVIILIAASFAPSVYGQGFPLERARFSGTVIFVAGMMVMGALVGVFVAQVRPGLLSERMLTGMMVVLFGLIILYPLRHAWLTIGLVPEYRDRGVAWDARQTYIMELKTQGQTDLLIPQLDGVYGIKEMDVDASHWVNRCAAVYYGVNSIRAIPPDDT